MARLLSPVKDLVSGLLKMGAITLKPGELIAIEPVSNAKWNRF